MGVFRDEAAEMPGASEEHFAFLATAKPTAWLTVGFVLLLVAGFAAWAFAADAVGVSAVSFLLT